MYSINITNFDSFKVAIRMNLIKNNTVTTEDMQLAEKIYGPDLDGIKNISTRNKPMVVRSKSGN